MNSIEKTIYNLFRSRPKAKQRLRNLYQTCFDFLPKPKAGSAYPINVRDGYFFGFHDHTPFSFDDTRLLANRICTPLRMPEKEDVLEVGFFSGPNFSLYTPVAETRAWMWHMGCKSQWCGDTGKFVFNDFDGKRHFGKIIDSQTGGISLLPDSIASVSMDGRWAVGYSFSRVERCMPGYGYKFGNKDEESDVCQPKHNGIHVIDIEKNAFRMLFSISDLAQIQPEQTMKQALHFVSHAVFNPKKNKFIFLHRWVQKDQLLKRWSRIFCLDVTGQELKVFPTTGMVSHMGWRDQDHVIAYCTVPEMPNGGYILFPEADPSAYRSLGDNQPDTDGHPSFEKTGRWMVTDTYPDRRRVQTLILYDAFRDIRYDVAKLPTYRKYQSVLPEKHWTCDLHPRFSRSGNMICFDATFSGHRSLCTLDLQNDLSVGDIRFISRS